RPVRHLGPDLGGGAALVLAVVPLGEVVGDLAAVAEAGELARLLRTSARAGEDQREVDAGEAARERPRLVASTRGERDVRVRGVAPGAAPLRVAVAHEH